ncbi:MAG: hypothetical protein Q8Q29_00615 [Actinomycetota bacterium]|nr:hypothetical protein [Actinomycetota bacterium]
MWAFADPSYGPRYLAIPEGPGWKIRVCGPAACFDRVSTDAGPELFLQREGRLGDVSAADFPRICGVPISYGLCPGTLTIEGRAQRIKLPETATVGAG